MSKRSISIFTEVKILILAWNIKYEILFGKFSLPHSNKICKKKVGTIHELSENAFLYVGIKSKITVCRNECKVQNAKCKVKGRFAPIL